MVRKTQKIKGTNPTFLAFSHPDWFLPYLDKLYCNLVQGFFLWLHISCFCCFNNFFFVLSFFGGSLWTSLLFIMGELKGVGSVAVRFFFFLSFLLFIPLFCLFLFVLLLVLLIVVLSAQVITCLSYAGFSFAKYSNRYYSKMLIWLPCSHLTNNWFQIHKDIFKWKYLLNGNIVQFY